MKIMFRNIAMLILCSGFSWAAPSVDPVKKLAPKNTKELEKIIKLVEQSYVDVRSITASFQQSYSRGGKVSQKVDGDLTIQRPKKMRWDYNEPKGKFFLANGESLTIYDPSLEQAIIIPQVEENQVPVGLAILLGHQKPSELFTFELIEKKKGKKHDTAEIKLTPKKAIPNVKEVVMNIELSSPMVILGTKVKDDFGGINAFSFSKIATNPKVKDKIFKANYPKKTSIVSGVNSFSIL